MTELYLPPHIAEQERRRYEALVLERVSVEDARSREFTEKLQQIDEGLFMVKAHDHPGSVLEAPRLWPGTPLRPGFYHILVKRPGVPLNVIVVHEHDRYVEPDSRVFDVLARGNLQERRVVDEIARDERNAHAAIEHARAGAKVERQDEIKERTDAITRVQITTDRSRPWTQNQSPAARRDARGRRPSST